MNEFTKTIVEWYEENKRELPWRESADPYLICMIRLILFPLIAAIAFAGLERTGLHPDAEYILMIVLIATAAPAAAMVTQLAQIYEKDSRYASVINVMSVICCIITMPLMVLIYEMLIG